jgi:DNA recombination protein RmuC
MFKLSDIMIEAIEIEWIYAGAGFAAGAFLTVIAFLRTITENAKLKAQNEAQHQAFENASSTLDLRFKATAQEALNTSAQQFLQLAQEKLSAAQKDGAHDLEKRQKAIDDLVKPMQENLKSLAGALEQVKGTDKALRDDLQNLSKETAKLVGALRDPAAQGRWGEYILEGLLEKSGLIKGQHYQMQVSLNTSEGRQRPDAVIDIRDGFKIIIDAKAPINEFTQRLSEDLSEDQYKELMVALARQVKSHIQKLGQKNYWENLDSPDFTVLFLPSEHLFSMALRADPGLLDLAAKNNIIVASPTLLMSLLRVVGMSWRQSELAKNAQDISALGSELYDRIFTFAGHMDTVGKGLERALGGYNKAVSSLETRVLVTARKLQEKHAAPADKIIEAPGQIDHAPRVLSISSDVQDIDAEDDQTPESKKRRA